MDVHNWNVSNVTNVRFMFNECIELTTTGNLAYWNSNGSSTSNITNVSYMFYNDAKIYDDAPGQWWDTNINPQMTTYTSCFFNNTWRNNYNSIPSAWK
jgi:hypothetical protein